MRHSSLIFCLVLTLTACGPYGEPPKSGVGFKTYEQYQQERAEREAAREAALRGPEQTVLPPERTAAADTNTEALVSEANEAIATATGAEQATEEVIIVEAEAASDASPLLDDEQQQVRAEISDEQDFEAVANRESIESDAERIASNRQQYVVIEPTDLPQRPGNLGPSIVDFALATTNPVGQPLYSRASLFSDSRFNRNCAKFSSSDLAQQDFLSKGGPKRDRMGIDPDGDGFACYWDPAPYRAARRAASGN